MNKDQLKGTTKDVAGKVEKEAGKLTGSEKHEAEGARKQVEGKIQKGVGNVKENVDDAMKRR